MPTEPFPKFVCVFNSQKEFVCDADAESLSLSGPAGDGETRVVPVKCLMSLNGHLLRHGGTNKSASQITDLRFAVLINLKPIQCLLAFHIKSPRGILMLVYN